MSSLIYVANTNVIELHGLKNAISGEFINDAMVSVTICVSDGGVPGAEVAGQTWPTTMDYVAASNGLYRALLEADVELTAKSKYIAVINADAGVNLDAHWEFPFVPQTRTKK